MLPNSYRLKYRAKRLLGVEGAKVADPTMPSVALPGSRGSISPDMPFTQPIFLSLYCRRSPFVFCSTATSSLLGRPAGLIALVCSVASAFGLPEWGASYSRAPDRLRFGQFHHRLRAAQDHRTDNRASGRWTPIAGTNLQFLGPSPGSNIASSLQPAQTTDSGYVPGRPRDTDRDFLLHLPAGDILVDALRRDESVVKYLGPMISLGEKLQGYLHHAFFTSFLSASGDLDRSSICVEFQPQVQSGTSRALPPQKPLEVGLMLTRDRLVQEQVVWPPTIMSLKIIFWPGGNARLAISMALASSGAAAYGLQLYFDFSGYSDMADRHSPQC